MIFATGDIHSKPNRLSMEAFPEQKEMTRDDYVVILGDFGLVWTKEEDKYEKNWLDWLEDKSFTTVFVDGNHENFSRLNAMPVETWQGGSVHKIRPHVIHLMRGEVFTLDDAVCFAFGGAPSHDISGLAAAEELEQNYAAGILDPGDKDFDAKLSKLKKLNRYSYTHPYRIKGTEWWPEELASEEEKQNGIENLRKHGCKVDFVFSHEGPSSAVALGWGGSFRPNPQSQYLEEVRQLLTDEEARPAYKAWLFGHYHENRRLTDREICLYEQITRIW